LILTEPLLIVNDLFNIKPILPLFRLSHLTLLLSTLFFFSSFINLDKNNFFLSFPSTVSSSLLIFSTINFLFILKVYILCLQSCMALILYCHHLPNSIWYASIATTSHKKLSKFFLPIKNKMRKRLSMITLLSSFNHFSL
jgi:hypothetical protein